MGADNNWRVQVRCGQQMAWVGALEEQAGGQLGKILCRGGGKSQRMTSSVCAIQAGEWSMASIRS